MGGETKEKENFGRKKKALVIMSDDKQKQKKATEDSRNKLSEVNSAMFIAMQCLPSKTMEIKHIVTFSHYK